jgi:hypothetical protein
MSYGLEICSIFQWNRSFVKYSLATEDNSICTYVFVFSSTEKALPLPAPLPLADTAVTLPLAHLRAHVLQNTLYINEYTPHPPAAMSDGQRKVQFWAFFKVPIRLYGDSRTLNNFTTSLHLQKAIKLCCTVTKKLAKYFAAYYTA